MKPKVRVRQLVVSTALMVLPLPAIAANVPARATHIDIDPTNLSDNPVNDMEIHANANITSITKITPPPFPFPIIAGTGTKKLTLSGGTLAAGGQIKAKIQLASNKGNITHYTWTNLGAVRGTSIRPYSAVPEGLSADQYPNDCHFTIAGEYLNKKGKVAKSKVKVDIKDNNKKYVKVIEPSGWSVSKIEKNSKGFTKISLKGPEIPPGTVVKVEVYADGFGPKPPKCPTAKIITTEWSWTRGDTKVKKSEPRYCFNDTGRPQTRLVAWATEPITSVYPDPPLPFTDVDGLGTRIVTLSGTTVEEEGVGDQQGMIQFNGEPSEGDFEVYVLWFPESIPTVSAWGLVVLSLLLLTAGKLYFGLRRRRAITQYTHD